jgi:hypothetical protein
MLMGRQGNLPPFLFRAIPAACIGADRRLSVNWRELFCKTLQFRADESTS